MALNCTCVINLCTFLSRPLQTQQREMAKWRTQMTADNFSCFDLELTAGITYLACMSKYHIGNGKKCKNSKIKYCENKIKYWQYYFIITKLY